MAHESDPPPPNTSAAPDTPDPQAEQKRREFLTRAACWALGGAAVLIPAGAGTIVWLSPLGKKGSGPVSVRLASLDSLPVNGPPALFQVLAERSDAWTREPASGLGAVFLQRTGDREVRAFNASCPHLGCAVEFRPELKGYFCPCHNSTFAPDGRINDPASPALRALDALEVDIRDNGDVWVVFENYRAGLAEKVPVA